MLARSDITVCIPSRARPASAVRVKRTLLPQALIYVAEQEAEDYLRAGIPKGDLRTHPNLVGLPRIRNFMLRECPTKVCIQADDDFGHVMVMPGRKIRIIRRPLQIAEIMYSTALVADDMGSRLFGWSNQAWPVYYKDYDPFGLKGYASRIRGVIGKDVVWDERMTDTDVDTTLQELLDNRIVYLDNRFYFWCGQIAGNKGGLQDIRTAEKHAVDKALLRQKWGDFVEFDKKSKQGLTVMRIAVERKQTFVKEVAGK